MQDDAPGQQLPEKKNEQLLLRQFHFQIIFNGNFQRLTH